MIYSVPWFPSIFSSSPPSSEWSYYDDNFPKALHEDGSSSSTGAVIFLIVAPQHFVAHLSAASMKAYTRFFSSLVLFSSLTFLPIFFEASLSTLGNPSATDRASTSFFDPESLEPALSSPPMLHALPLSIYCWDDNWVSQDCCTASL